MEILGKNYKKACKPRWGEWGISSTDKFVSICKSWTSKHLQFDKLGVFWTFTFHVLEVKRNGIKNQNDFL